MDRLEVPMEIEPAPAWLSWVGSVATCLRALGSDADPVDVAGYSGYAFHLTVNDGVCVSGPTCVDWCALSAGIALACGRSVTTHVSLECHTEDRRSDRSLAHAREVFELASREIAAGHPCVVWGLGVPEFGVVRGVEGEEYLCVAAGPTPDRLRWDEVSAPGGPAFWGFPLPNTPHAGADRFAIRRGAQAITKLARGATEVCGLPAYETWAGHLEARRASRWGHAYNAQCWAEARAFARDFVGRVGERNEAVAEPLGHAREALAEVASSLGELAARFPFTMDREPIEDAAEIDAGAKLLRTARAAEERALEGLIAALAAWPEE